MEQWVQGKISTSECQILISQWVEQAWEKLCHQYQKTIIHSFEKYGISLPINGSRDSGINIEGLAVYRPPDRGQFVSFNPRDSDGQFDDIATSDSDCESDSSSMTWNDIETLQLGEYVLE